MKSIRNGTFQNFTKGLRTFTVLKDDNMIEDFLKKALIFEVVRGNLCQLVTFVSSFSGTGS